MKKVLFVAILCALCVSFGAVAKEYRKGEIKSCEESLINDFLADSKNNIMLLEKACDLNGQPLNGVLKYYYDYNETHLQNEIEYKNGNADGVLKSYSMFTGSLIFQNSI